MEHIAIDLGSRESQLCVRDETGRILEQRRCRTQALAWHLKRRAPARVVLETSAEAFTVADLARAHGHEVRVVPATLVRALGVGARGIKTDVRDAQVLSEASCRMDLPSVHVPSAVSRRLRAMSTAREALVTARTQLINAVRGLLRTATIVLPRTGSSKLFAQKVRARVPDVTPAIERMLVVIETLSIQIHAADEEIAGVAATDPVCQRLMSVPGVGAVTAVRFCAAVDDPHRFASGAHLGSYLGLTPREQQSGLMHRRSRLTKAGPPQVRRTLVQAAWSLWRTRPEDPIVHWAKDVAERRGKAIAIIALTRKLATVLLAIWKDGTTYDPTRPRHDGGVRT